MKTNDNITPAQFVEKWLPRYDERFAALIHGHDLTEDELVSERFMFGEENIGEALAAFEAHIRQETWLEACGAQRESCGEYLAKEWNREPRPTSLLAILLKKIVRNATIPEIPKNEKI